MITLYGKTNSDVKIEEVFFEVVEGLIITVKGGKETVEIDDKGNFRLVWKDCYIVRVNGMDVENSRSKGLLTNNKAILNFLLLMNNFSNKVEYIGLGLSDDCDEDYQIILTDFVIKDASPLYVVYKELHEDGNYSRWYWGTYTDKNKANEVAMELTNNETVWGNVCDAEDAVKLGIEILPDNIIALSE